ncbi:hypothetical protein [Luteolibacter sp. LG18]|uniref:hypothetical protein n=1 Tax=Luteolibacter sp. LG18 TaxID=2819286 RepID=UPI002B2CB982|nr:hypothetical protein llg_44150 [Luteolibacter sp. LG18]
MNTRRTLAAASGCTLLLLASLAARHFHGPSFRGPSFRGPSFRGPSFRGPSFRDAASRSASAHRQPEPSGDHDADLNLLAKTRALATAFERFHAHPDDIDLFRKAAEIENEFTQHLDPRSAAILVRKMPAGFVDTRFGTLALAKWATADRLEAAGWMAVHPGTTPTATSALARGWFAEAPCSLKAHLDALPSGDWKSHLALTASEDALVSRDSQATLDLLDRVDTRDPHRAQLQEWTFTSWATIDPSAAASQAAREPDAKRREVLLAAVVIGEANLSPEAAAENLARQVMTPETRKPALEAIARIWGPQDHEAAYRWMQSLPPGEEREFVRTELIQTTEAP